MTAPNTQTTSLAAMAVVPNPDGMLGGPVKIQALANANATLTAAQMINSIITMTQNANFTLTGDTYANLANQVGALPANGVPPPQGIPAGASFDMTVQALGATANTIITFTPGTGTVASGNATCGVLTGALPIMTFRAVFQANNTVTFYRL